VLTYSGDAIGKEATMRNFLLSIVLIMGAALAGCGQHATGPDSSTYTDPFFEAQSDPPFGTSIDRVGERRARGTFEGTRTRYDIWPAQGEFQGEWKDHRGHVIGELVGRFWTDSSYVGRMSATVTSLSGETMLLELDGQWRYDDPRMCPMCGAGHGILEGETRGNRKGRLGKFHGEFGDWSAIPEDQVMPFWGNWVLGGRGSGMSIVAKGH